MTNQDIIEAYRREAERKEKMEELKTRLFEEHRNDYISAPTQHEDFKPRGSYVYEWFTIEPRLVFYVGKGKNKRFNHILKEIEAFHKGSGRGSGAGSIWQDLKDNFGIDCHIVVDDLSNEEAEEIEEYFIVSRIIEDQPLLQHVIAWNDERVTDEIYDQWYWWNYPPKGSTHSDLIKQKRT